MSFKKFTTVAAIVAAGFTFSTSAQADELSLEQFVSATVSNLFAATKQELHYNVQEAVLTANNMLSFDESEVYATKVEIKDVEVDEAEANKAE